MAWKILTAAKANVISRIGKSHVVGSTFHDAVVISRSIARFGWSCTFGLWPEESDSPKNVAGKYLTALQGIIREGTASCLSVKLFRLGYDFGLLKEVLEAAKFSGNRIQFDAMDHASTSNTFAMVEKSMVVHSNLGCTLPARWARSERDAEWAAELGIFVRIVRGQWPDPNGSRFQRPAMFLKLVEKLCGRVKGVAVATHDEQLALRALESLKLAGTRCELELMIGLPLKGAEMAREIGVPVRIYIPYGAASLPYRISDLMTRPAVLAWATRDLTMGKRKKIYRMCDKRIRQFPSIAKSHFMNTHSWEWKC
ncbi:MAG: hypothetical protein HYY49_08455 [Ignavibacteriales bacterium]|nr:hypothetical protein [Ignavibacteriales bacterium]